MTALIGGILLAAGVMLYLLEPVFSGRGAPSFAGDDDHDEGAARRRAALTALRDLEYDRMTGKLDGKDYELLKGELSRDALRRLGPHPDGGGSDPRLERADRALEEEIAQLRKALREGLQCAGCDHVNRTGARFCGRCGQRLDPSQSPPGDSTASVAAGAGGFSTGCL